MLTVLTHNDHYQQKRVVCSVGWIYLLAILEINVASKKTESKYSDWAKKEGMTREEFIDDVMATAAALGTMLLDENGTPDNVIGWTVIDNGHDKNVRIAIHRIDR